MKKLLILCILSVFIVPILFLGYRYINNPVSIIPYPYKFKENLYANIQTSASILIAGDAMAARLAQFKDDLAQNVSGNIEKVIEIDSIAEPGEGIHRTVEKIKSLKRLPLIIILISNTDNGEEIIYKASHTKKIHKNLEIYENPLVQSLLLVMPSLSRFFYYPVDYIYLTQDIVSDKSLSNGDEVNYQQKMQMHYKLYSAAMSDLLAFTTKRNSIVIPVTAPLNLRSKPEKSCYGSLNPGTEENFNKAIKLFKRRDFKSSYNLTKDLVLINSSHAATYYLHGLVSEKLNNYKAAYQAFISAKAYDCGNSQTHPIFNNILKQQSLLYGIEYLDFNRFLYNQSLKNTVFLDEIYPQDIFLQKLNEMLAIKIKNLLKL